MSSCFHKPKVYRSSTGCCICKAKSSSSRFTDSKKYEDDFMECFKLKERRQGEICNACVLLVKRWKKLPADCNRDWQHVVDARAGPGIKSLTKFKAKNKKKPVIKDTCIEKIEKIVKKKHVYLKPEREQSPQESDEANDEDNTSKSSSRPGTPEDCDDIVVKKRFKRAKRRNIDENLSSPIDWIDLTIYKKTRICCGIIFKGPYGEIIIDQSLFKTCSSCLLRQKNKQQLINTNNSFHSSSVSPPHSVDSATATTTTSTELTKQTGKIFSDSSSDSGYDESSNQGIDGRKNIKISNSNNNSSSINNSCITTTKKLTNILIPPVKKIPIKLIPIKQVEKLTCKSLVSTTKQVNSLVDFAIHTPRQSVTN
ncbi:hypothetical protein HCN44_001130 [Aphidius gifuensis]|uniref:Protein FAM60A n=1 Tax=Aphidius gifuensis TaxID=684658 RepID=A0A834XKL9_APHGI|nr:SIN3-HDAC complex-associated factor [Aphidius gifuensis]XP_044014658.1 SIN3-HDAC complex-associated factor [Aphidius gifuensis]KAF7988557.1 hypothetical protein HCN44_001130 [Aphidius gifuensis]